MVRGRGWSWEGVERRRYKEPDDSFRGVSRQEILGARAGEEALGFVTRYFEVEPGGYTSLERHRHSHSVVVVRGRGEVLLGDRLEPIAPHDCVYVPPGVLHRFLAAADEPLGFLCVVDRERDRPQPPAPDELRRLAADPALRRALGD